MVKLPNEVLNRVFEEARLAEISFVKLLRVLNYNGQLYFDWRGHPIFTEATFPRFDPASTDPGPFEERNQLDFRVLRRVEDWWNNRRPTEAPLHPKAPLRWTNAAARRIALGDNPVELKIQTGLLDESKHKYKGGFFMPNSKFDALNVSKVILNSTLDILCLQVGDLSDHYPSMDNDKFVVPLSEPYPDTVRISNLAVEFHGPTTRVWCRSCLDRFDGRDFVHDPNGCNKSVDATCYRQPCDEEYCGDCEKCAETSNHHGAIFDLLKHFPAAGTLFLIDWAYEPVGADPDPSTAHASSGDYDFFLVEKGAGEGRWRAERPCPFESLYCAESIEKGFKWHLAVEQISLKDEIAAVHKSLASQKLWGPESGWDDSQLELREEREEKAQRLPLKLDATRRMAERGLRCQVLAAVKKKKFSSKKNSTESVAGSSGQATKRRLGGSEHERGPQAKRRA
ncbi:unnamed protein product [Clonostachys byssicola]|uniref:Uncharacterized protein n=1 Tax=Clonostachys byssicola TaxID=160290 RepID=A0A9N9TZY2_9HYPO|nr:unnamed protein product [Clonostachys byssicola]